jgi:hypothetical protein
VRVLLHVDRDSVAAGDDDDPHALSIEIDAAMPMASVLTRLNDDKYLPQIYGGEATWVVRSERRGRALAVIAQQWAKPKLLVVSDEIARTTTTLFFEYLAQRDPSEVYAELL